MTTLYPAGVDYCTTSSPCSWSSCPPPFQLYHSYWVFATYNLTSKVTIKLQFNMPVDVIVLFSHYPFNFGYAGNFCVNSDYTYQTFSGQTIEFTADLSQYYMLVAVDVTNLNAIYCGPYVNNGISSTMPLSLTIYVNGIEQDIKQSSQPFMANYDSIEESGICNGINLQQVVPSNECSNGVISGFYLQPSGIYVATTTCNGVLQLKLLKLKCKNQITNKLIPLPRPFTLIKSSWWNQIIDDIFYAYSIYQQLNDLTKNLKLIMNNISASSLSYQYISSFCNFLYSPTPYFFTYLRHVKKGDFFYVEDFNRVLNALNKLSRQANAMLPYGFQFALPSQVVSAFNFYPLVNNLNYLLKFANNTLWRYSETGEEIQNIPPYSTILNLVISQLLYSINVGNNSYIKNFIILSTILGLFPCLPQLFITTVTLNDQASVYFFVANYLTNLIMYGSSSIANAYLEKLSGEIILSDNATINNLIIYNSITNVYILSGIYLYNYSTIENVEIIESETSIFFYDNTFINNIIVKNSTVYIYTNNNASFNNIQCENSTVYVNGNTVCSPS